MFIQIATITFTALISILILFQLALALGAPWGQYAMGGYYPGKYPSHMRIASLVQIIIYGVILTLVYSRVGIIMPELKEISRIGLWVIVVLLGVGVVMNLISQSVWERRIWTPVALGMFVATIIIALS